MTHFGELAASADLHSDSAIWPTGIVLLWPGTGTPSGFLPCDGSTQAIATYPALDAMIGNGPGYGNAGYHAYNAGVSPGSGLFRLPDFRDALPLGLTTPASTQARTAANGGKLGNALSHTHGGGSLGIDDHYHNPGTLTIGDHVHGQNFSLNNHTHSTPATRSDGVHGGIVMGRLIYTTQGAYGSLAVSGNTDGPNGWYGGNTYWAESTTNLLLGSGATAAATVPHLGLAFIVKT